MNNSNLENELNQALIDFFTGVIKIIWISIKNCFLGIKKLIKPLNILGLVISFIATYIAYLNQQNILGIKQLFDVDIPVFIRYLIYWLCLLIPFWYLIILGSFQSKLVDYYYNIFKDIEFKGRDKKYPILIFKKIDDKKTVYLFKSNISLAEWKKNKERLETALDCTIMKIEQGKNKKLVQLTTIDSSYRIPEMIEWNDELIVKKDGVVTIGESYIYKIMFNLNKSPHVLVGGETGSGKSVILRLLLWQLANKNTKLFMIDFKGGVEFGKAYEKYGEVITDRNRADEVLEKLVAENSARLALFRELEVKNLKEYNDKSGSNLCRIAVFVDEIAEMLDKKGVSKADKEIFEKLEGKISTLARLSRATGINLFLGTQRPDANVLTGQIKNNMTVRISGRFADKSASEIVLGNTMACDLPDIQGRFMYKMGNETMEFQAYYFDDETMLKDIDVKVGDLLIEPKKQAELNKEDEGEEDEGENEENNNDDVFVIEEETEEINDDLENNLVLDLNYDDY